MTTRVWRACREVGLAEGADPVGDGLESGERGTAVGERPQDDDEGGPVEQPDAAAWPDVGTGVAGHAVGGMAWTGRVPIAFLRYPATTTKPRLKMKK